MQIKVDDYVKGQFPGKWVWEGQVIEVRFQQGFLEYPIIKFRLNPHLYPASGVVELPNKYIFEVNGVKYNWYKDWLKAPIVEE